MAVLHKNIRYKQLSCLYSKITKNQLGPLKVSDPDLESFMQKADPEQYGVATVNFKITNGVWQKTGSQPDDLKFARQFLTREQAAVLLP